jgi:hypothetical protein
MGMMKISFPADSDFFGALENDADERPGFVAKWRSSSVPFQYFPCEYDCRIIFVPES